VSPKRGGWLTSCQPPYYSVRSEVESKFSSKRTRGHIVSSRESGQEIVERDFIGDVHGGKLQTPFISFAVKQVVMSNRQIKEVPCCDAWRIMIVVFGARGRDRD
jgi:hypothetical protein